MTKKQKTELEEHGVGRYREGYLLAIFVVTCNLGEIADNLNDHDPHAANVLRWIAELISTYQPDE